MKILLLDIETAPNTAYVWGLFKENIPIQRLISSGYVLCWAAKWLGSDGMMFDSIQNQTTPHKMLKGIHHLLDESDAVIHYNGTHFDIPTLNKEFVINGMAPPSPYKQIDLLKVVRNQFRLPSNKLAYVAEAFGIKQKVVHTGWQLWIDCMANNPKAWEAMADYNIGDIDTLEELYYKILPWIKNHPNHSITSGGKIVCPNCGSINHHKRGTVSTNGAIYQRYQCQDCTKWFRGIKNEGTRSTACVA